MKTAVNSDVAAALAGLEKRAIRHIFLVACGGSLSVMMPGKYFLDRYAGTITSDVFNAAEFVCRDPKKLGPEALVILCSQTGATKETVRAADHARSRGAATIGMTLDPNSPLAQASEFVINYRASYTTGIPIDSADSNYGVLYMMLAGLLDQRERQDLVPPLLASLSKLKSAIDRAKAEYAPRLERFVPGFSTKPAIYTLASGPAYGAAYSLSICVLMEMQWYDSQAIHADEFFHGPFEVVDKDACFIVLVGLDETRRLTERARDFLLKYGCSDNMLILDAAEFDLGGMDPRFAPYLVPLICFDILWAFAYRLAELRDQPMLEGRRYMKKIANY